MADTEDQNILSPDAQVAQSSLAHQASTNTTQDSSAAMSLPLSSPVNKSPDVARDSLLSPTAASHPLPARPDSAVSSTLSTPNKVQPSASLPAPRTRGGFEVDDDEEENEETADGQDEVDVYEPAEAFDADAATPAHVQTPIDRTSQSPQRENGTTTAPDQPSGSPSGAPSALPSGAVNVVVETPTEQVTPKPAQVSPSRFDVNGFLPVPKTRLAHDVVGILEDRIKSDPRGDPDAYLDLISELKSRNKQSEVRDVYDKYLKVFPHDVSSSACTLCRGATNSLRPSNGAILSNLRSSMTTVKPWRQSSASLYSVSSISTCGHSTLITSGEETHCQPEAMYRNLTALSNDHFHLLSTTSAWTRTPADCGKTILLS